MWSSGTHGPFLSFPGGEHGRARARSWNGRRIEQRLNVCKELCSFVLPTARSETAWHGRIHWRLRLRLGAFSWPPRRGPEGAWDSVGWSQNPSVAGAFASETRTFAKRGQNLSTSHVPQKHHPRQQNCMARRDSLAPRPATWGPPVATLARPRGRLGQRGPEPESLRSKGICVGNEDVCKARTALDYSTCPP